MSTKIKWLMSLLCLMTACTAYSQSSYPRVVVIDGDTVEAITRPQMRSLILLSYSYQECDSERSILSAQVGELQSVSTRQDSLFKATQEEIGGYDAEVRLLNGLIANKDSELKIDDRMLRRQKTRSIIGGTTGALVVGGISFLIGILCHR